MRSLFITIVLFLGAQLASAKEETILYIRGQFSDKPMGLTDAKWRKKVETMHKTLEDYWILHSYGNITSIKPTYTPPITLPKTSEAYFHYNDLAEGMKAAAKREGFDSKKFQHVVFLYPSIKHNISFGGLGGGGQIWLPGQNPFDGGLIHEFGHSLGLGHSHSIEGEPDGETVFPGERREGRDGLHMMGSDSNKRIGSYSTINVPMRHQLRFIDEKHIKLVRGSGTFRLIEYELKELPDTGLVGLRIPVNEEEFWLSFGPEMAKRWGNYPADTFAKGVIVHHMKGSSISLLDFTPKSIGANKNEEDYIDTRDGALAVGKIYTIPNSTISIHPMEVGKTEGGLRYIDVQISHKPIQPDLHSRFIGGAKGSAQVEDDQITITASTGPMKKKLESLLYYARPVKEEDDTLSATIRSFQGGTSNSRVGVMFRHHEGTDSPHASLLLQGDGALSMIWREKRGSANNGAKIVLEPGQIKQLGFKLVRKKTTVTGSYTLDGQSWTEIKTVPLPHASEQLKGIAISSGDSRNEITVQFDQVNL